jgi:hypothetical protein
MLSGVTDIFIYLLHALFRLSVYVLCCSSIVCLMLCYFSYEHFTLPSFNSWIDLRQRNWSTTFLVEKQNALFWLKSIEYWVFLRKFQKIHFPLIMVRSSSMNGHVSRFQLPYLKLFGQFLCPTLGDRNHHLITFGPELFWKG